MFGDFDKGDTAEVEYTSARSGNVVTRKGDIVQIPEEGKRGFFIKTKDEQLTGIMDGRVYSLTFGEENGEPSLQRKTYLGKFESVSEA